MTAPELLRAIEARGVSLRVEAGALKLRPAAALDARVLAEITAAKPQIIAILKEREYSQAAPSLFDAGAAYDPALATVEAHRLYRAGDVTEAQRDTLLSYASDAGASTRKETAR